MARVTVEDCVRQVPNRFELVVMSAQRARNISAGSPLSLERDNDKDPVVALREIADETIPLEDLKDSVISSLQTRVEVDEPDEDDIDFSAVQRELNSGASPEKITVSVIGGKTTYASEAPVDSKHS